MILSILASESPLTRTRCFFGTKATASHVWKPPSTNFLISAPLIPYSSSLMIGVGPFISSISSSSDTAYYTISSCYFLLLPLCFSACIFVIVLNLKLNYKTTKTTLKDFCACYCWLTKLCFSFKKIELISGLFSHANRIARNGRSYSLLEQNMFTVRLINLTMDCKELYLDY
jgi:hypothetical protein